MKEIVLLDSSIFLVTHTSINSIVCTMITTFRNVFIYTQGFISYCITTSSVIEFYNTFTTIIGSKTIFDKVPLQAYILFCIHKMKEHENISSFLCFTLKYIAKSIFFLTVEQKDESAYWKIFKGMCLFGGTLKPCLWYNFKMF